MVGFEQGVRHYNQIHGASIDVIGWSSETGEGSFIGDFCCADDGYAAAERLLEAGADVIMPVAGPFIGPGAAARIKEWGSAYVIGVDTDWVLSFPQFAGFVLTSVEKKVDASVLSAVEAIANGTFQGGTHVGTLANGRVGLAPFHSLEGLVSEQVKAELQQIEADIIAGRIKTMP
jgi:basic membrane protein A